MKYFAQNQVESTAPHHEGVEALWRLKWQKRCSMGIYPFPDGKYEDFEKIFDVLIKKNLKEPYDVDDYASAFVPVAEDLERQGDALLPTDGKAAAELYLSVVPVRAW
jgi:hypothetical protein